MWYTPLMQEAVDTVFTQKAKLTVEIDESLHRKAKSKAALGGESLASVVRGLLSEWVGGRSLPVEPVLFVPAARTVEQRSVPEVEFVRCDLRNSMVPSEKCSLELGHDGSHVFA